MHKGIWAWILVLVLCCWSGLSQNVTANCNEDIKLPCRVSYPGINYRYLVWYRDVTAIIKRKLNDVRFYNKSSPASLGVQDTLVLQNVQPSDSGYYQCFLAAEVGQKDMQSYVSLTVSECMTSSPTWTTSENQCIFDVVEVSVLWNLIGFSLISLSKIIFCIVIVKVCKRHRGSEARYRGGRSRNESRKDRNKIHF